MDTVKTVNDLITCISDLSNQDHIYFFRGQADKTFELKPSIYRKKEWYSNEDQIIREILTRCPNEFSSMQTAFEKLVKMQHYSLPTRLLDITENPLVALYFACVGDDEKDKDGMVCIFKIPKKDIKYFDSDTVSVIANVAWANPSHFEVHAYYGSNSKGFHNEKNPHALKLLHDIRQEKPHFLERIEPNHIQSVVCVKPKMDNARVIRQDGAFLLFGIEQNKHQHAKIPDSWCHKVSDGDIAINAADKQKLLNQLASIGISKAKLFPEIDTVSQFIKSDSSLSDKDFASIIQKQVKAPGFNMQ